MFDWVQLRALAGPLKDIHRAGCVLTVVVLLEVELSAQSEVLSALGQVFIKDISVLCSVEFSLKPSQSLRPCYWKIPPQHYAATDMLHRWAGIGEVMSSVWFPPDMTLRVEADCSAWPGGWLWEVVPNVFHLRIFEEPSVQFFCSFPPICAWTHSYLWALQAVPSTSWLGFCSDRLWLSAVRSYIDTRVPFQSMSNQLNLPQADSNKSVETWSRQMVGIWAKY